MNENCDHQTVKLYEPGVWKCMVCRAVFIPEIPGREQLEKQTEIERSAIEVKFRKDNGQDPEGQLPEYLFWKLQWIEANAKIDTVCEYLRK